MNDSSSSHQLDPNAVEQLLSSSGPLARSMRGFESREQQKQMLQDIVRAYNEDSIALIEAGTGTGKSMAYLLPAILWAYKTKQRTVISTATIALQEQIIHKDIPILLRALGVDVEAVLVKGMGNYVCKRRLADMENEIHTLATDEGKQMQQISDFCSRATSGSRSDLPMVPKPAVWEKIRAEGDTCRPKKCPHQKNCFFLQERAKAEEAQILVVNHHLLFADLAMRSNPEQKDGVLPAYHRVVIDEAHHIEDIATDFFAAETSRLDILHLLARLGSEQLSKTEQGETEKGRLIWLQERIQHHVGPRPFRQEEELIRQLDTDIKAQRLDLITLLTHLFQALRLFLSTTVEKKGSGDTKLRLLQKHIGSPFWLENVHASAKGFLQELAKYQEAIDSILHAVSESSREELVKDTSSLRLEISAYNNRLREAADVIERIVFGQHDPEKVCWLTEMQRKNIENISLTSADLDVSKALANHLFQKFPTVVLCSATLTTNRQFHFVRSRLGLVPALLPEKVIRDSIYDSPFAFSTQALLAVPQQMPLPNAPGFLASATEQILSCIRACRGNAFVLFTSYSMLQSVYEKLEDSLRQGRFVPMRQGEDSRQRLLERFRKTDYSVLFGTDSFWEGVDVAGDALRCVIIVKLPFQVPSEPIVEARSEAIAARGGNPFMEYSVPQAIMKFKQGFGRLIRKQDDRGCIICLDSRLVNKRYGSLFIKSLPPCPYITDGATLVQRVKGFYAARPH